MHSTHQISHLCRYGFVLDNSDSCCEEDAVSISLDALTAACKKRSVNAEVLCAAGIAAGVAAVVTEASLGRISGVEEGSRQQAREQEGGCEHGGKFHGVLS